jgi:hypothetical protein
MACLLHRIRAAGFPLKWFLNMSCRVVELAKDQNGRVSHSHFPRVSQRLIFFAL